LVAPPDIVAIILGFARTLRYAGVAATPDRVHALVSALGHLDVLDAAQVYWAGRLTLCADPEALVRYDAAFAAYFGDATMLRPPASRTAVRYRAQPFDVDVAAGDADRTPDSSPEQAVRASRHEILRHRDVARLSAADRDELRRLFALLSPRVGRRRTRRHRPAPRGRVDLERTVRHMLAHGGEPGHLAYRRRRTKPRRLVLLVDISGSMEPYADALLRLGHAAVRTAPSATEVFTLGTRLTRVTRELRRRDPDRALRAAGAAIPDWSGGTRLGEQLKAFLDRWGQRGTARGAVVVLCSDGWERGDARLLGEQTARLARLAHAVVWVNPHKGKDGFAPLTAGLQAALPHVDDLVAGHSFAAFEHLAQLLARV
jgi:uncharacterized protein with von Willebrand factor type A (vWA) domain